MRKALRKYARHLRIKAILWNKRLRLCFVFKGKAEPLAYTEEKMQNILIVVDMQKDFIDGALGTKEAVSIVPKVYEKIKGFVGEVIFTRDTHLENYMETQEGRNLPVKHCVKNTDGWQICSQLRELCTGEIVDKPTFGSEKLGLMLKEMNENEKIEKITLVGLCTDICVISNALLIKAFLPETEIAVDASCCAGVTPESHENALKAMKMCQIKIENE
jgi:nicotinamidase/pyrazinamidase